MYSGRGIEGKRKIPVSHAVNTDNRVPDEIKSFGHRVIKLYLDTRIKRLNTIILKFLDWLENRLLLCEKNDIH